MKFKISIIFLLLVSCATNYTKSQNKIPYNSKGFAYIFNEADYQNKIIKGRLDNDQLQIAHKNLSANTLIKIINPKTKEALTIKSLKKIDYPDFYKILITKEVANRLQIDKELPLVEILELKKNKSFIAKKAKIFNEEKKISSNAPVTSVKISNISKNKDIKKNIGKEKIRILIATFYSKETAEFLKKRITIEIPNYDIKKLKIRQKNDKKIELTSGPYKTINLMKNDYILLKGFGFEDLEVFADE